MKRKIGKVIMMMAGIAFIAAPAMAEVVFSDDFTDGNRDGWFKYNDADGSRTLDASAGYLETGSSGWGLWGGVANFASVTLNDGEFINLSLDFQIIEDIGSATMVLGLFNSGGTTILADQANLTNLEDESGYYMYNRSTEMSLVVNGGLGLGQVNGTNRRAKLVPPSSIVTASPDWYTYSLTIVNSNGTITATQETSETATQSYSWSTPSISTFDTVAIQAITKDFAIDNVVVTTGVIPEPGTLGLMSIAGLGVYMMRRRKI